MLRLSLPRRMIRSIALISLTFFTYDTHAEKLRITSTPPGAKVKINGVAVGTTPFEKDYPGGYLRKTKTAVGSRRDHPLVARLCAHGGNPFFGQPKHVDLATYLGGGRDFLTVSGPPSPHIISRNLTPTPKTGLPEGDHTFDGFLTIFCTGKDFDHLHPNCSATITTNCFPVPTLIDPVPPVDGDLLQVMPRPNFKDLTDHVIRAIYEYLKTVPCIQGNYPDPSGAAAGIPAEPAVRCSP